MIGNAGCRALVSRADSRERSSSNLMVHRWPSKRRAVTGFARTTVLRRRAAKDLAILRKKTREIDDSAS
jgi:hypothetical protein